MSTSTASIGSDLHVVTIHDGHLYHTCRLENGEWTHWGWMTAEGALFVEVSCAGMERNLHVVVKDELGIYWHNIRFHDGRWQGFFQMNQPLLAGRDAND